MTVTQTKLTCFSIKYLAIYVSLVFSMSKQYEGKNTNQRKENNHTDVGLKQFLQVPKLLHGACRDRMIKYKELIVPT